MNLIKAWKDREALLALGDQPLKKEEGISEVQIPESMSVSQQQEVREFLQCNEGFFSKLKAAQM